LLPTAAMRPATSKPGTLSFGLRSPWGIQPQTLRTHGLTAMTAAVRAAREATAAPAPVSALPDLDPAAGLAGALRGGGFPALST